MYLSSPTIKTNRMCSWKQCYCVSVNQVVPSSSLIVLHVVFGCSLLCLWLVVVSGLPSSPWPRDKAAVG